MKGTKLKILVVLMVTMFAITGCGGGDTPTDSAYNLSLSIDNSSISVGGTAQITATITPSNATLPIAYSSDNTSIATVTDNGLITGVGEGFATITVTAGEKTSFVYVYVSESVVASVVSVDNVTLTLVKSSIDKNETVQSNVLIAPLNATNSVVRYSSSNVGVATVSNNGAVTGVNAGTANITATVDDKYHSVPVTVTNVTAPTIQVSNVLFVISNSTINVGDTAITRVFISPNNATDQVVKYSSDNTSVATVNELGMITGVGAGSATITVTAGGQSSSGQVAVVIPVENITLSIAKATIDINEATSTSVTVSPTNATQQSVTYSSNDESIAKVNHNGVVTGVGVGSAYISAAAGNKTSHVKVTVTETFAAFVAVDSVTFTIAKNSLDAGENVATTVSILPPNATDQTVTYSSDNISIASVSDTGTVLGIGTGNTTLTATVGGKSSTVQVDVAERVVNVTLTVANSALEIGETTTTNVLLYPSNVANPTITYLSDNTSVATVADNGSITAIGEGSATITAMADGKSGTARVSVTKPYVAVSNITFTVPSSTISINETITADVSVSPPDATNRKVLYSSDNTSIATVNVNGAITGVKAGVAIITAMVDGQSTTSKITVVGSAIEPVAVDSVTLMISKSTINVGDTEPTSVSVLPVNATNQIVTYITENPTIATVDASGNVTGVEAGEVTIRAIAGGKTSSVTVKVTGIADQIVAVDSVLLTVPKTTINTGETIAATVSISPTHATNQEVIYTTGNSNIALVNNSGSVIGINSGTTNLTATVDGKYDSVQITVVVPVTSVSLDIAKTTINADEKVAITTSVLPANASDKVVKYTSDNESIATVDANGEVTGVGEGIATITATAGGKTATVKITVIDEKEIFAVSSFYSIMHIAQKDTFTVKISPRSSVGDTPIKISVSDSSIIELAEDELVLDLQGYASTLFTANRAGTASITAEVNGESKSVEIRVIDGYYKEGDTWHISNAAGLLAFRDHVNTSSANTGTNAILINDITLDPNVSWTPISPSDALAYEGTFHGDNHTITNMRIEGSGKDYQGMFGFIHSKGIVKHLRIDRAFVVGRDNVGVLVGYNDGDIENVYVNNSQAGGTNNIGGAIGNNGSNSTIGGLYLTVMQVIGNENIGGAIGYNNSTVNTIETTDVSVTGSENVGGAIGYSSSGKNLVGLSATRANVAGGVNVGGLVGYSLSNINQASFDQSEVHSTGENVGGVLGYGNQSDIVNAYITRSTITGRESTGGVVGRAINVDITHGHVLNSDIISSYKNAGGVVGSIYGGSIKAMRINQSKIGYTKSDTSFGSEGNSLGGFIGILEGVVKIELSHISYTEISGPETFGNYFGGIVGQVKSTTGTYLSLYGTYVFDVYFSGGRLEGSVAGLAPDFNNLGNGSVTFSIVGKDTYIVGFDTDFEMTRGGQYSDILGVSRLATINELKDKMNDLNMELIKDTSSEYLYDTNEAYSLPQIRHKGSLSSVISLTVESNEIFAFSNAPTYIEYSTIPSDISGNEVVFDHEPGYISVSSDGEITVKGSGTTVVTVSASGNPALSETVIVYSQIVDDSGTILIDSHFGLHTLEQYAHSGYSNINVKLTSDIVLVESIDSSIGSAFQQGFSGTFDGDNHTITNVYSTSERKHKPIFGTILSGAVVKNLNINDAGFTQASIALQNFGTISNVHVSRSAVFGNDASGNISKNTGGIVVTNEGTITNSSVTKTTVEGSTYAGGIAAQNNGGTIEATSVIESTVKGNYAGGIAGIHEFGGVISTSYVDDTNIQGNSDSSSLVSGIASIVKPSTSNGATKIISTYTNDVKFTNYKSAGGIVAENGGSDIVANYFVSSVETLPAIAIGTTNSTGAKRLATSSEFSKGATSNMNGALGDVDYYYSSETPPKIVHKDNVNTVVGIMPVHSDYIVTAGGATKIESKLYPSDKSQAVTYSEFDNNIINVNETGDITYVAPGTTTVKITSKDNTNVYTTVEVFAHETDSSGAWLIDSEEDLSLIAELLANRGLSVDAKLTNNITLTQSWTPIGASDNHYNGTFNGDNYTISGLNVDNSTAGLFAYLGKDGVVQNLGVIDATVSGLNTGTIASYNYGTIISSYVENATITSTSSSYGNAGGIVAVNYGTVSSSYVKGAVFTSGGKVGGIVGYNNAQIIFSYVDGVKFVNSAIAGGIAGLNTYSTTIKGNYVHDLDMQNISLYKGGIVGQSYADINNNFFISSDTSLYGIGQYKSDGSISTGSVRLASIAELQSNIAVMNNSGIESDNYFDPNTEVGKLPNFISSSSLTKPVSITANSFISMFANDPKTISYSVYPSRFTGGVVFSVADDTILTVETNGLIKFVSSGSTTVTLTTKENSELSATVQVEVMNMDNNGWWQIDNAFNLVKFQQHVDQVSIYSVEMINAILIDNITLKRNADGTSNWTSIGQNSGYRGRFTGNNHTISGIHIVANDNSKSQGLFAKIYDSPFGGSVISNLGIINVEITGGNEVGAIAGLASLKDGTVRNVYVDNVTLSGVDVGGMFGSVRANVERVYATNVKITGESDIGGIAGVAYGTFNNAYADDVVLNVQKSSARVGGITGIIGKHPYMNDDEYSSLKRTYIRGLKINNADISSSVGGVVGGVYDDSILSNNFYVSTDNQLPGVGASNSNINATRLVSDEELRASVNFLNTGINEFDYYFSYELTPKFIDEADVTMPMDMAIANSSVTVTPAQQYSINGTQLFPSGVNQSVTYTSDNDAIVSVTNGGQISYVSSGNATITVKSSNNPYLYREISVASLNVDSSGTWFISDEFSLNKFREHVNAGNVDTDAILTQNISLNSNWSVPIGALAIEYKGTFDGNGKTISNMVINNPTEEHQGLFGVIATDGVVKNLGIVDANVTAGYYAGGIVGRNRGRISGSYVASSKITGLCVGGIAGKNHGIIEGTYAESVVVNNFGTTNGYDHELWAGGIVGDNTYIIAGTYVINSQISNAHGGYVGGIAGSSGSNSTSVLISSYISNVNFFSSDSGKRGAIVGNGTISNYSANFYYHVDETLYGIAGTEFHDGFLRYDTLQILSDNDHKMTARLANEGYGHIKYSTDDVPPKLIVTEPVSNNSVRADALYSYYVAPTNATDTWQVDSAEGLVMFSQYVNAGNTNANIILQGDITLDENSGFVAIGNATSNYQGTFDGNSYTINGLHINADSSYYQGLFGYIGTDGVVKNVSVINANIKGSQYVGAISGQNDGTIISSYVDNATVESISFNVGGISGYNKGTITATYTNDLTVKGIDKIGAIAGENTGALNANYFVSDNAMLYGVGDPQSNINATKLDSMILLNNVVNQMNDALNRLAIHVGKEYVVQGVDKAPALIDVK